MNMLQIAIAAHDIKQAIRVACSTCQTWGRTIEAEPGWSVPCPDCKRHTHPNAGVNMPAGASLTHGRLMVLDGQARFQAFQAMSRECMYIERPVLSRNCWLRPSMKKPSVPMNMKEVHHNLRVRSLLHNTGILFRS